MAKYIIGVDLGGTNLKIGLFGQNIKIKDKRILETRRYAFKNSLIGVIVRAIKEIAVDNKLSLRDFWGAGFGFPGPIDYKKGIVHFLPNIPGWQNVGLKKILEKRLGIDIHIDNDANLMSLAEYKSGAAKGYRNAFCLTLGTGVGGGIIFDGKVYRGRAYCAGEFGHIPINEHGPFCNCGGQACIESYIGNRRILARAKASFKKDISLEELGRLSQNGNQKAIKIWQDVGRMLGVALTGVVNLLNPDCIVIGGGLSNVGKVLFDNIKNTIKERAMAVQANYVKILRAKLGTEAGLIGAAIMAKEKGMV